MGHTWRMVCGSVVWRRSHGRVRQCAWPSWSETGPRVSRFDVVSRCAAAAAVFSAWRLGYGSGDTDGGGSCVIIARCCWRSRYCCNGCRQAEEASGRGTQEEERVPRQEEGQEEPVGRYPVRGAMRERPVRGAPACPKMVLPKMALPKMALPKMGHLTTWRPLGATLPLLPTSFEFNTPRRATRRRASPCSRRWGGVKTHNYLTCRSA